MVDFKKLLNNRKHYLPVTKAPKDRAQVHNNLDAARRASYQRRDIGPDVDREMADPQYLASLELFVDTRS